MNKKERAWLDAFQFTIHGRTCLLDAEDARGLFGRSISIDGGGYLRLKKGKQNVLLHRHLMGLERGDPTEVDHINGNRQDNRRLNLRFATASQNGMNRKLRPNSQSGVTGVYWSSDRERWCAHIAVKGRRMALGRFVRKADAMAARAAAEDKYHGMYAARHGAQCGN